MRSPSRSAPAGGNRCGGAASEFSMAGKTRRHTETRPGAGPLSAAGHAEERWPRDRQRKQRVFWRHWAAKCEGEKQLKQRPTRSVGTGRRGGRAAQRCRRLAPRESAISHPPGVGRAALDEKTAPPRPGWSRRRSTILGAQDVAGGMAVAVAVAGAAERDAPASAKRAGRRT